MTVVLIPGQWKRYVSNARKSVIYNALLNRRCLTIFCYVGGDPVATYSIGQHAYEGAPEPYFSVVRPVDFDTRQLIKAESKLLLDMLWKDIDFDELTNLLGRPPEEW